MATPEKMYAGTSNGIIRVVNMNNAVGLKLLQ